MSMPPTRLPDPWKSRTGAGPRRGRPRRKIEPAQASAAIDRGLHDFVGRSFPDLWEDLSDDGREMFVRGLMEAASRPLIASVLSGPYLACPPTATSGVCRGLWTIGACGWATGA